MSIEDLFVFENGAARGLLDLRSYRLAAIKKAAYRIADRCTAALGSPTDERLPLTLTFKAGTSETAAKECVRLFLEELLDQELRAEIAAETEPLRVLILAHAFSKTDLIRHDS